MSLLYNNKLYLTNVFSITLADGLYDLDAINNIVLGGVLNTKYYKIIFNALKTQYSIYLFNTIADRTNNTNGTVMDPIVVDSYLLNTELYSGIVLPLAYKVICNLFDVHENLNLSLIKTNETIVPIDSTPMTRTHFEFQDVKFNNMIDDSSYILIEVRDLKNRIISFDANNPINLFILFEE